LTEQQKKDKIATITQQTDALKEQISNARAETNAHVEKRDKLNAQFKKLRQEINELKNERDNLNTQVKTLKQHRDEARIGIKTIIEEIKAHKQQITELKKGKPKKTQRELQKELADIEWKIQTTPLAMPDEKRLVENVKQIETQLTVYRKIDKHIKKIAELQEELEKLKRTADAAHRELTEFAKKSQETHSKMISKINEANSIKGEADSLHAAYLQAKERSKPLHEEFRKLTEQKKTLQEAMRKEEETQKKLAEKVLKEKLESQARDKLRRGEKLSFEEFQLLATDDSEESQT
jgi:uncharacterized coiled-coil DUF342 family protein